MKQRTSTPLSRRFWLQLVLSAIVLQVATCAALAAEASQGLQFVDRYVPGVYLYKTDPGVTPWTAEDRAAFEAVWSQLRDKLPGLVQRATAYRPIYLYRVPSIQGGKRILMARYMDQAVMVSDQFMSQLHDKSRSRGQLLAEMAHETTHLIDMAYRISWGKEWVAFTQPRLDKVYARFETETGQKVGELLWQLANPENAEARAKLSKIAHEEGFPRGYAALNLHESLAESVASAALSTRSSVPPEVKDFVRSHCWAIPWQPNDVDRLSNQGLAALYRGDVEQAIPALKAALAADPQCVKLYAYLGMAYRFRGNINVALSHLTTAIERAPATDGNALEQRASILFRSGNRRAALADCERILKEVAEPDLQQWAAKQIKEHQ